MHRVTSQNTTGVLSAFPVYEPPYPGAVQDELAWHLVKYLREDARLRSEVEVEVPAGPGHGPAFFTLDLVVEVPDEAGGVRRIAFETASERTLRDHDRRLRRDATLLAHGAVDVVYRLRGSDLLGHTADVLYLASRWDADAFLRARADQPEDAREPRRPGRSRSDPSSRACSSRTPSTPRTPTRPRSATSGTSRTGRAPHVPRPPARPSVRVGVGPRTPSARSRRWSRPPLRKAS